MTQATYEFIKAVKNVKKRKLTVKIKVLIFFIIIVTISFILFNLYIQFVPNSFDSTIISICVGLYLLLISLTVGYIWAKRHQYEKNFDYLKNIKYGFVKDILEIMRCKQLPLKIVAPIIKKDIEEHLAEIQKIKENYIHAIIVIFKGVLVIPMAFFLSLYFQLLFNPDIVTSTGALEDNFAAIQSFIWVVFKLLVLVMLLAIAIYRPCSDICKDISGENSFSHYLNVLHEIEINIECDKIAAAKNFPKKQKVFCCKKHL